MESPPTDDELESALLPATQKLLRIIEREGDADGERMKPYYLKQLIREHIQSVRFARFCETRYKEKKSVAYANALN
jgi:hypothetical protein